MVLLIAPFGIGGAVIGLMFGTRAGIIVARYMVRRASEPTQ